MRERERKCRAAEIDLRREKKLAKDIAAARKTPEEQDGDDNFAERLKKRPAFQVHLHNQIFRDILRLINNYPI